MGLPGVIAKSALPGGTPPGFTFINAGGRIGKKALRGWKAGIIMEKVVLLTGGSSGIGLAAGKALAMSGCRVYEISRKPAEHPGITHLTGDVTDEASIREAVAEVLSREGRIDILINNAGFGISGAVEFTEPEEAKRQLEVNFFGMVNTCHVVLPHMREAGQGRILNLSSVAAVVPIPFQTFYSASKAAINSYTMALGNEVRPFGISVCAVMPGDIHTGFTAARQKQVRGDDVYGGRISRSVAKMEKDELTGMKPEAAGAYVAKIALRKNVKPLYAIRLDYKFYTILARILPVRTFSALIRALYAG